MRWNVKNFFDILFEFLGINISVFFEQHFVFQNSINFFFNSEQTLLLKYKTICLPWTPYFLDTGLYVYHGHLTSQIQDYMFTMDTLLLRYRTICLPWTPYFSDTGLYVYHGHLTSQIQDYMLTVDTLYTGPSVLLYPSLSQSQSFFIFYI